MAYDSIATGDVRSVEAGEASSSRVYDGPFKNLADVNVELQDG